MVDPDQLAARIAMMQGKRVIGGSGDRAAATKLLEQLDVPVLTSRCGKQLRCDAEPAVDVADEHRA